jgi:superfamily II helicase
MDDLIPISYGCDVCGESVNISEPIENEYDGAWLCPKCAETYKSEEEILSSAIAHYGEPAQVLKCIEELAELMEVLADILASQSPDSNETRNICDRAAHIGIQCAVAQTKNNVHFSADGYDEKEHAEWLVSELADVSITTSQMRKMFTTPEEFEKVKQAKLSRLADMISGKYNPGGDCGSIGDDETFEDIHGPIDGGDSQ